MPGPDKMKALLAFLVQHFDSDDLEWILRRLPDEGHLLAEIPSYQQLAPKKFARRVILQLSRRPSLQQPFFGLLAEERPGVADEAATLAEMWVRSTVEPAYKAQPVSVHPSPVEQPTTRRATSSERAPVVSSPGRVVSAPVVPSWAEAVGTDSYGRWARIKVGQATAKMRWIEPGSFVMGSPENEDGRDDDELQHPVELTRGYWLADAPCTQGFWEAVMGENLSRFKGAQRPVENVSWMDAMDFCLALQARLPGSDGEGFRLPTEAEWEYACRAGTTAATYAGVYELDQIAWYENNSEESTQPVRRRHPNAWGLYDMLGNVWEWCADRFGDYTAATAVNPIGPAAGTDRVMRGGSWIDGARFVRAAIRGGFEPGNRVVIVGFRFARGPALGR